jgi:hypothetical protein
MKKQLILSVLISFCLITMAQNQEDTLVVKLNEVVINSQKETSPQQTPVSSTILNSKQINAAQITNVRDLSGMVPNFYIPDYGSAMSTTSYIRGTDRETADNRWVCMSIMYRILINQLLILIFMISARLKYCVDRKGTLYGRNAMREEL